MPESILTTQNFVHAAAALNKDMAAKVARA
jgi:hypothetical protein